MTRRSTPCSLRCVSDLDPKLKALLEAVKGKRARTVIDHLLKYGSITNEELKDKYGYNHPPRAIRDVRENGVPITTERIQDSTGRSIARYTLGSPGEIESHKLGGRQVFPRELMDALYEIQAGRCALSGVSYERRYLQVDHRIPYEIAGEASIVAEVSNTGAFMLVSGAANRQKSWSCEHCANLTGPRDPAVCSGCYWASPGSYEHIATRKLRTVNLTWEGEALSEHARLLEKAQASGIPLPEFILQVLRDSLKE